MTPDAAAAPAMPRWLGTAWLWLPAAAGLALFGGAALLQLGDAPRAVWWSAAAGGCAGAYAVRERWPVPALAASLLVVASARLPGVDVLGPGLDVIGLALLCVPVLPLMAVGSRLTAPHSLAALAVTAAVTIGVAPDPAWSGTTFSTQATVAQWVLTVGVPLMIAAGAWLAGYAIGARRRHADALLGRAASLEARRDAEAARAVAEERATIARELHDVVTHTVAVMVVQASAAGAVWDRDPAAARASLAAVEESGRTIMADLRGMLDALWAEPEPPAADRRARPGLEQLPELVRQIRTAGLAADLTVSGPVDRVAPLTGASLLRIAQESVTNALRHARAATIDITVAVGADTVALSIADDGVGLEATREAADALDPQRDGGRGLVGMRERAAVAGGTLDAGPRAGGGTLIAVRAPLRHAA